MSDLRSLFPDSNYIQNISGNAIQQLYVYNTNFYTAQNGGRCCLWTVPAGSVWARFELWGAGGDGAGGCCCQGMGHGGGSGTYARKTIRVNPGDSYTICAAGSGCCAQQCCGTQGLPSYVCNPSATYPICMCASGGSPGDTRCFYQTSGCYSCSANVCGCTCGATFSLCGLQGAHYDGVYCGFDSFHYAPQGPVFGGGARVSFDGCNNFNGCTNIGSGSSFVGFGAGGGNANVNGGPCCWGGFGQMGLVIVTYK